MSGILLLLLAFSIGGSLCAGTPPENGGDSLFSQLTRGETNPGRHAARRNGNMLIIRTDKGAGSGFIVNKWNRPVIVSNAHVYLTGRNPRVFDVNDREYEIKEVIASKSRDLVFLVFEPFPGETAKPLEVEEDVSALEPDTRLTAYGNSLAGNVIRRSDGVLQAVGPQTIETTVPFVTGNSGGPLVTTDGGKVVGVATYMIRIRDDWTKQGSGFEQKKWWKPVVRRFATRIDNIDVSDLEQIDMRKIAECDLTMCERAQEVTRQLKEANNSQDFAAILFGNLSLIAEGRSFAWNSSYLKKQFAEDTELFTAITERLELGDLLELLDPLALLYQNASEVTYARIQPAKTKCFFCSGYGQITKHVPRPGYDPNSGESSLITKKIPCVVCRQTGKRAISHPGTMMQAPEAVIQSLADRVQPVPITFQGFTLGTTNKEFFQSYPFYRNTRAILLRRPVPFGEEIIYRGNHKDRDIKATSLTFMCGKLVEIRLFLNHEGDAPEELLKQYIALPLPDGYPLQAGARFLKDPLDIPCDRSGRAVLDIKRVSEDSRQSFFRNESPAPRHGVFLPSQPQPDSFMTNTVILSCRHNLPRAMQFLDYSRFRSVPQPGR